MFDDAAVVGFLADYTDGVLELGGGHPIIPDRDKQERVNEAVRPYNRRGSLPIRENVVATVSERRGSCRRPTREPQIRQRPSRLTDNASVAGRLLRASRPQPMYADGPSTASAVCRHAVHRWHKVRQNVLLGKPGQHRRRKTVKPDGLLCRIHGDQRCEA